MENTDIFFRNSGLKVLAMAKLTSCEYSICLYLMNCRISGIKQFITNESELSSLIGFDIPTTKQSIVSLQEKNMIQAKKSYSNANAHNSHSMMISFEIDMSQWKIDSDNNVTVQDAIVYPFRRIHQSLTVLEGDAESENFDPNQDRMTYSRVAESFINHCNPEDSDNKTLLKEAKTLVETHPVDQVLLLIRHFKERIPNLSLLASSWKHYVEMFENETMKVELSQARKEHDERDKVFLENTKKELSDALKNNLTSDEVAVLKLFMHHRYPRRQLFWAYQARSRYPQLKRFFEQNYDLMIPISNSGQIVKR